MGPAKIRNRFSRPPGTIPFLQVGVSSTRGATFELWEPFFQIVVRDSARHGSKVTEGLSNIEVPGTQSVPGIRGIRGDAAPEMAQGPQPGASHPHARGIQMT